MQDNIGQVYSIHLIKTLLSGINQYCRVLILNFLLLTTKVATGKESVSL